MNKKELPDDQLIKLYLDRDDEAFEILYLRYKNVLYSYLNKLMPGQQALIDDIFQQTWMKVVTKMDKYTEQQTFLAWVIRIARNLSIDHFRKATRHNMSGFEEMDNIATTLSLPSSDIECNELGDAISQAVELLPPEQKEVFILRQQNVSFKEIAVIQDTTLNTTLGRMHYATLKLRQLLKDWI